MSGYQGRCPSCGAEIVFELGATLLRVCGHCGSAVARKDAKLESYGKVAALIPTLSVLRLGAEGRREGVGAFRLVGHLQLDFGAGVWDEWLAALPGERWAWLAEAQGRFYWMEELEPAPPVPAHAELAPGRTIDLGDRGTFVTSDVRKASFAAAEGELPFAIKPGTELAYADLSGPRGQLATLDYGAGTELEAVYVGREVKLAELAMTGLAEDADRRVATEARTLSCPQCGGPLELRAPDHTRRVGCPWCGSLLDAGERFAVLEVLSQKVEVAIPLGSKGKLDGVTWTAIGHLERSVTVEDERYPWREVLLYEPEHGFRWLVESKGHWSFVGPAHAGDVSQGPSVRGAPSVELGGRRFRHFSSGRARVDRVVGEFYWEISTGQEVEVADWIAPPEALSEERDGQEITWSHGRHLEPGELWQAFGLPGKPPEREGVGMCQPNPHAAAARGIGRRAALFALGAIVLFALFRARGGDELLRQEFAIPRDVAPGAAESAFFTEPIRIERPGNVEIRIDAPVDNSWLYLDGALVEQLSGEVREFDAQVSYYHGSDWREGRTHATRFLGRVPPGSWLLRLAPQWEPGKAPERFVVRLRGRVPRGTHLALVLLALTLWPLVSLWRRGRFELRRWAESDHPLVETS